MNSVLVSTVITRLKIHYSNTLFRCLLHTISTHKRQQTFKTKKKINNFCPISGANKSSKILHSTQYNGMSHAQIIQTKL